MVGESKSLNAFRTKDYNRADSTKLNARLALRQRADLLVAYISTNRISLPQGQSYTGQILSS